MLEMRNSSPSLCLLLLCLAPHGAERNHLPPKRRFEYKLSFKGPRLTLPGAGIPFWSHHGDAILGTEEVRLVPSMRNRSGAVWSRVSVPFPAWEVEVQMRVTGPGHRGAQGMVVWYTQSRGQVGSALEGLAPWDGIAIFFDSLAKDAKNSPAIHVLTSDRHHPQGHLGDGGPRALGSCYQDFRNRPYPFTARITYWGQRLHMSFSGGLTPSDPDEVCVDVGPLLLAPGGFFGVSAATTSTLADDHDVLSFLTFSLSEPSPEAAPQHFPEMEQLRLARQLEELKAKLALGTRKVTIPQPNAKVQDEGERLFDLEETLRRQSRVLQALQALSGQLTQAERQWKKQLASLGQARPDEYWDSTKVRTLLHGQRSLLQTLHEMRDAAARVATDARVFYLPVGTEHHFFELDQIVSFLQKDLRGLVKTTAKASHPAGWRPGTSICLQTSIFLFFLLVQTIAFFCYMNFSKQELDKRLQQYLLSGSLHLGPVPHITRRLGALKRQSVSPSMQA